MVTNESNVHPSPNSVHVSNHRSLNGLQQWAKPIPYSRRHDYEYGKQVKRETHGNRLVYDGHLNLNGHLVVNGIVCIQSFIHSTEASYWHEMPDKYTK